MKMKLSKTEKCFSLYRLNHLCRPLLHGPNFFVSLHASSDTQKTEVTTGLSTVELCQDVSFKPLRPTFLIEKFSQNQTVPNPLMSTPTYVDHFCTLHISSLAFTQAGTHKNRGHHWTQHGRIVSGREFQVATTDILDRKYCRHQTVLNSLMSTSSSRSQFLLETSHIFTHFLVPHVSDFYIIRKRQL